MPLTLPSILLRPVGFGFTVVLLLPFRVLREQWIRAKYDRKEFLAEATDQDRSYTTGQRMCTLQLLLIAGFSP